MRSLGLFRYDFGSFGLVMPFDLEGIESGRPVVLDGLQTAGVYFVYGCLLPESLTLNMNEMRTYCVKSWKSCWWYSW